MQKSDYESFFSHPLINFTNKVYFGVSHFWNRAKVAVGWVNYDQIVLSQRGKGRVLLGQLPGDHFNLELFKELSPYGLIVSCNESYELAGSETIVPVTKPFLWGATGIEHHHLPFIDFSDKVHPSLLVETLIKMKETYLRGGTIYVHCKAGRSRSPLIVALFNTILNLESKPLPIDSSDKVLRPLLEKAIKSLSKKRPQTNIDEDKIILGVQVLQQYLGKPILDNQEEYTQSAVFFSKLTQAPEFKALWHFAYNNSQYLADVQLLMKALYENPLRVLTTVSALNKQLFDSELAHACGDICENDFGKKILIQLEKFLFINQTPAEQPQSNLRQAYERFNLALHRYKSEAVINCARQLQSQLFLASVMVDDEDKASWLIKTAEFLDDPINKFESYSKQAETAILSYNPWVSQLGQGMQYLAATVFILTFLVGIFSTSTIIYPVIIGIAVGSLVFIAFGNLIQKSALETEVRDDSLELASEVMNRLR